MSSNTPDPDEYRVPTVEELDAIRDAYGISRSEFSRRAGREVSAWSEIVRDDIDPQASTLQTFLEVLQETDPNGDRRRRGRDPEPACQPDGGVP